MLFKPKRHSRATSGVNPEPRMHINIIYKRRISRYNRTGSISRFEILAKREQLDDLPITVMIVDWLIGAAGGEIW